MGHILTFSEKKQISAILCFATYDWFCPITSHILYSQVWFGNESLVGELFALHADLCNLG